MRIFWTSARSSHFWVGPAFLGVTFIALGIAVWLRPELLAYFVASILILTGAVFIGVAWTFRRRVTYRTLRGDDPLIPDEDRE